MALEAEMAALKAAYAEWDRSKGESIDTWVGMFGEPANLFTLAGGRGTLPANGTVTSPEDVRAYLESLVGAFRMNHFRTQHFVAEGDTIVAISDISWSHRETDKPFNSPHVGVWRFSNGKVAAYSEYYDTAAMAAASS